MPVDVEFDLHLARLGAKALVDRYRRADAVRRGRWIGQLLDMRADAVQRLIASEVERLTEPLRERLYDASSPDVNRMGHRETASDDEGRISNRRKGAMRRTVLGPIPETASKSPGERNGCVDSPVDRDSR